MLACFRSDYLLETAASSAAVGLQVEVDSRQCPDAVLPSPFCRHAAVLDRQGVLHHGQLWMGDRDAAVGAHLLRHDRLDHLSG